jgi:cobalt-zinc-cadmium efflux system outer membrane protein
VRAREAKTLQASLLPNPEFEAELGEFGGSGDRSGFDGAEATIQLSQLIELGGKRAKRVRLAAIETDLAGWDYEATRLDVLADVSKTFVEVLAAQERLALTEELALLSEQTLETVSERVKAGKVSPLEATKAEVALSVSRIQWERAKLRLAAARKRLVATWGSTRPTFENVIGEFGAIKPIPSAEQLGDLAPQNPDIVRWVAEMDRRRTALDLEKAKRIPDLTVSAGVQLFEETTDSAVAPAAGTAPQTGQGVQRSRKRTDNAFVLGVSIPIPIFDRNQGRILEARYRLNQVEQERKAAKVRLLTELADTYQALSAAFAEATALKREVLPGAERAFEAAGEGYRQGKFGYLDVLDSQRTLFEARGGYIEALASYHKAVVDVERLIGEDISNLDNTPTEQ